MTAPAIALAGVRYRWRRGAPLVLDVPDFRVGAGERVFLHGPSGSGKSTLLNLLAGVLRPETGSVRVLDVDLATLPPARRDALRADHIGYVFQLFNLLPYLSIEDNVLLPCRFSRRRREEATARGGSDRGEARRLLAALGLPGDALAQRVVARLSVGQQQRVALARALIGAPTIVIADEPTSALDAALRGKFVDLLFDHCAATGAALVFVSHDPACAGRFDRVVPLADINHAGPEAA